MLETTSVPEGTYRVRVSTVKASTTRAGHARWALRLTVCDGGRWEDCHAGWDSIVISPDAPQLARAKRVLDILGFDGVPGNAADLMGCTAIVTFRRCIVVSSDGAPLARLEVPHDGWRTAR